MTLLKRVIAEFRGLFHKKEVEQELDAELHEFLERAVEQKLRAGMSREEATRAARMELGSLEAVKDRVRDVGWESVFDSFYRDGRYAIRSLRKSPGFSTVAVLTLALGIGATTAIYSVVDTVLLQPLPFLDSDGLVRVVENISSIFGGPPVQRLVRYPEFVEWRARAKTLSEVTAISPLGQRMVRTSEGTAPLWGGMTSANTFTLLGARAMLGRTLGSGDDANPDVVVLSFDTWQRLFHSERGVVGTTIELRAPQPMFQGGVSLDGRLLTIVGVMPADFELPMEPMDFYTPFVLDGASKQSPGVTFIGRLRRGVSLQVASDEANVIGSAIRPPRPANAPPLTVPRFEVQNLKDQIVRGLQPALRVLLAAVAAVLLIVCANVANLVLARGSARQREMAVRFGLGASRGRLVRQILTECLVLAIVGGALGALVAAAGVALVKDLASIDAPGIFRFTFGDSILPRGNEVGIDLKMLVIAFGIAALTSVVFGILPALHLSSTTHLHAMGSRGAGAGRGESRIRSVLVVGQLVMATTLLVGAGLLTRSFVKLSNVEKGYDSSNVLVFQLVLPADYSIARKTNTIETLLARLRATPNVEAAGVTRHGVLIPEEITVGTFVPQGRTLDEMGANPVKPRLRPVSHGYLTAMGVRLLGGREFEAADAATKPPVLVINRTVARQYFGEDNPVGQSVDWHVGRRPAHRMQVVGVVQDVRNQSPDLEAFPEIFIDYRQLLSLQQRWGDSTQRQDEMAIGFMSFAVRTRGDSASAIPVVGRIVRAVDPNAGIDAMVPMDRLVASSVARQRFYAVMLGVFAGVAGLLAAIGVYGVLAYAVIQRTQEIGIRMALGAQRAQVLALVLRKGLILTTAGVAFGLVGAAAATRFLQGMLFGITPLDPKTFIAVSLMFGCVAALACYMPARRATRVDPLVALRCE
jgi:predicted permease